MTKMMKQTKEYNYTVLWSESDVVKFLNDMQDEIHIVNIIKNDSTACSKYIVFYYKKIYK